MSFAITVYVREGIVMAADSRLTLNRTAHQDGKPVERLMVSQTDSNQKLFLAPNGMGVLTYGDAAVGNVPLAGYVQSFFDESLPGEADVCAVAEALLAFFRACQPVPATHFHVAGYSPGAGGSEQQVWHVDVAGNRCKRLNPVRGQGASWGGETDILARLLQPVAELDAQGKVVRKLPRHEIPWSFFTLQDAIDFAIFATRSTIDAIRFMPRAKTVGGPIDVLVLQPGGSHWIQRKTLHGG